MMYRAFHGLGAKGRTGGPEAMSYKVMTDF